MNKLSIFAGVLALALHPHAAEAGNPAKGKEKSVTCAACHGEDGNGIDPTYPKLAGQYESYLVHALKEYRAGRRQNAIMMPMAAALTDEDIADLAAYFGSLPSDLYVVGRGK